MAWLDSEPPQEQNCPSLERMNQNANVWGRGGGDRWLLLQVTMPSGCKEGSSLLEGDRVEGRGGVGSGGVRVLPNRSRVLEPCGWSNLAWPLGVHMIPWRKKKKKVSDLITGENKMCETATSWTVRSTLVFCVLLNLWSLLKLMSIELMMPSNHLLLCHPLLLLLSIFPSIRVFSNESSLHIRWPKYWSFSFSTSPSSKCSGWFP